jgi:hypothetical protein
VREIVAMVKRYPPSPESEAVIRRFDDEPTQVDDVYSSNVVGGSNDAYSIGDSSGNNNNNNSDNYNNNYNNDNNNDYRESSDYYTTQKYENGQRDVYNDIGDDVYDSNNNNNSGGGGVSEDAAVVDDQIVSSNSNTVGEYTVLDLVQVLAYLKVCSTCCESARGNMVECEE